MHKTFGIYIYILYSDINLLVHLWVDDINVHSDD